MKENDNNKKQNVTRLRRGRTKLFDQQTFAKKPWADSSSEFFTPSKKDFVKEVLLKYQHKHNLTNDEIRAMMMPGKSQEERKALITDDRMKKWFTQNSRHNILDDAFQYFDRLYLELLASGKLDDIESNLTNAKRKYQMEALRSIWPRRYSSPSQNEFITQAEGRSFYFYSEFKEVEKRTFYLRILPFENGIAPFEAMLSGASPYDIRSLVEGFVIATLYGDYVPEGNTSVFFLQGLGTLRIPEHLDQRQREQMAFKAVMVGKSLMYEEPNLEQFDRIFIGDAQFFDATWMNREFTPSKRRHSSPSTEYSSANAQDEYEPGRKGRIRSAKLMSRFNDYIKDIGVTRETVSALFDKNFRTSYYE